jgi:imidazolonepropionase-like amidohydrolase
MTVVIRGRRITAVEPADDIRLDDTVERVDGSGRYLIPGLWDMHTLQLQIGFPYYLANGVTGLWTFMNDRDGAEESRRAIQAGEEIGPRFLTVDNLLDGPLPWWPGYPVASTPEEGRALVEEYADLGETFINMYSLLEPDVYRAIINRAHEVGVRAGGHVPFAVTAAEASRLGVATMDHLMGVVEGCSRGEAEVLAARAAWRAGRTFPGPHPYPFYDPGLYRQMVEGFDQALCEDLLDQLAANQTWQVPTLVALRSIALMDDSAFMAHPLLAYLPEGVSQYWEATAAAFRFQREDPDDLAAVRSFFELQLKITGLAAEHGVPILAGTDSGIPYTLAGFSLQEELELLVDAGLTPHQALRAATFDPAVFLGATDSLGTVAAGKLADLVLLDSNPLENISNTQDIVAVVADGRFYERAFLDELLADRKRAASAKSIADVIRPVIDERGVEAGIEHYWALRESAPKEYKLGEEELNGLGYVYLRRGETDIAIEIFKLNVELYPDAFNTYDSLAEAYMEAGQTELSIQNYRRALELNPDSDNAKQMLKRLGVDPEDKG